MLLCIGYTSVVSVVQCEQMVVLRSDEMPNFLAAECGKAIRGVIRATFRTWFSANYPLTTFAFLKIAYSRRWSQHDGKTVAAAFGCIIQQEMCSYLVKELHI